MVAKEKEGREAVEAEVERLENEIGELEEKLEDAIQTVGSSMKSVIDIGIG